jgi:osmotically-inducible protein OsmY
MNQRDQYSGGRSGGREMNEQGGRQGRTMSQRSFEDERDWQSQQRTDAPRSEFSRRLAETYNPEPQWLREDEYRGASAYERDEQEMSSRGWGRETAYGERGMPGQRDLGRGGYAENREFMRSGAQGYGSAGQARGSWLEDEGNEGRQGPMAYGEGGQRAMGYGSGEGRYGSMAYGQSTRGYGSQEAGRYGSQGFGSQSEYSRGAFQGSNLGYGSNVGYRGQFDTGASSGRYQSGLEGQRSYRGMGPQNYSRSDDRIRDDICERLTDDDRIDASQVTIDVNQCTVTLSGTVPERAMRYYAEDLVDDVLGVQSINNQLKVQQDTGREAGRSSGTGSEGKRH